MVKEFFLPVPLYVQDDCYNNTNERCGAACTQMVLHDIDSQRPLTAGEQGDLFKEINKNNPPVGGGAWHNPPQGIKRVLNDLKPATRPLQRSQLKKEIQDIFTSFPPDYTTPYEFVIYGDGSPETNSNPGIPRAADVSAQIEQIELLSRQIIRTIALRGAAPIVAVREDNAHWLVVNGFQVEEDYSDAKPDQRGRIKAMIIRNPLGRYTYTNVDCGDLSDEEIEVITGHNCKLIPNEPDIVPYATWVREYMFSDWAETFVEVCDWSGQVADELLTRIYCAASTTHKKPVMKVICDPIVRLVRAFCGIFTKSEIDANAAIDRARIAIDDFKLAQINPRVSPRNALRPFKVKRMDRIDGDYYLVPVGEGKKISALINISVKGEFQGATVLPLNVPGEGGGNPGKPCEPEDKDKREFYKAISEPIDHYIGPFDDHPGFAALTRNRDSSLSGRTIRFPGDDRTMTITSVVRDEETPYVWRPSPKSFSASRPFHNLKISVQGRETPIRFYHPVDDYCLPTDKDTGDILLPSANYLEMVADCIKQKAGNTIGEVLAQVNRRGTTVMVMYRSYKTGATIGPEVEEMKKRICQCLNAHPYAGIGFYRIKAFATNAFLTSQMGGGEDGPIATIPRSGGGEDGIPINPCPPLP
jgi:hypothetical protein